MKSHNTPWRSVQSWVDKKPATESDVCGTDDGRLTVPGHQTWDGEAALRVRSRTSSWNDEITVNGGWSADEYIHSSPAQRCTCWQRMIQFQGTFSNQILHAPRSTASQRYSLRRRTHSFQLPGHSTPLSDCNFLIGICYIKTAISFRIVYCCTLFIGLPSVIPVIE